MVGMKVRLSRKGQLVIPKVIRNAVGLVENRTVIVEIKDKGIEIRAIPEEDLAKKWDERAKKHGGNVSKWVYGDKLYEEGFK